MVRSFLAKFSPKSEGRLLALCLNNLNNNEQESKEWNKKAVRHLVKELGRDLRSLDELERAISQQNPRTKCVLVPKTLDRRLLISHRRGLPQVIYCRLWRWPDLQSHHQIKAISSCESCDDSPPGPIERPVENKKICINPYHYERISPKPIDPVLVPCPRIPPDLSTSFEDSDTTGETKARPGNLNFLSNPQSDVSGGLYRNMVNEFAPPAPSAQYSHPPRPLLYEQQQFHQQQQQQRQQQQQQLQSQQQELQQQQRHQYGSPGPGEFHDVPARQQQQPQFVHSQEAYSYQSQSLDAYGASQEPHYQQTQEHYQHSPNSQYHQQYQSGADLQDSSGTVGAQPSSQQQLVTHLPAPYRFRPPRFVPFPCEQTAGVRYPQQESHAYVTPSSYGYSPQPQASGQMQVSYQQAGSTKGQPGDPSQVQQTCRVTGYPAADNQSILYAPQTPASTYTPVYSPEQKYQPQDQQMQMHYQANQSPTQAAETYYEPGVSGLGQPMDETPIIDIQEVPYTEGAYWCSISYHEYDQRIGEKYHSNCRIVSVDGYTQPMCSDRFCIGGISNVNRNQFTEWVRRRIGRGVRFSYVDGELYAEGLSESSIFVSNPLVIDETDDLADHVTKLTQGCSTKVFSTQDFSKLLTEAVSKGFEAVYRLTNCCVIRVSFVKGWGKNYKRQSIFNTPCWVEIQVNGPLQWIDKVLRQMRPPTGCGSTS